MKITPFLLLLTLLTGCSAVGRYFRFSDNRIKGKDAQTTFKRIKDKLTCAPSLLSSKIHEKSRVNKISIEYGDIRLTRTDVGEPEGKLYVSFGEKGCSIDISLVQDIYYSNKDRTLILVESSGSSSHVEAFYIDTSCHYLGQAELSKENKNYIEEYWKTQVDGSLRCES